MTWFLRIGAVLLLTLGMASLAFASTADGKTAGTAFPLPSSLSATGTLVGQSFGAFTFYTLDYAGNGSVGTITLNVSPTDPNTTNAVGVNLYHAGANLPTMNGLSLTPGRNTGSFSSATAGPILVEVYNYLRGQTASYNFAITGVTP
jgi:hypothetical protein